MLVAHISWFHTTSVHDWGTWFLTAPVHLCNIFNHANSIIFWFHATCFFKFHTLGSLTPFTHSFPVPWNPVWGANNLGISWCNGSSLILVITWQVSRVHIKTPGVCVRMAIRLFSWPPSGKRWWLLLQLLVLHYWIGVCVRWWWWMYTLLCEGYNWVGWWSSPLYCTIGWRLHLLGATAWCQGWSSIATTPSLLKYALISLMHISIYM